MVVIVHFAHHVQPKGIPSTLFRKGDHKKRTARPLVVLLLMAMVVVIVVILLDAV